MRTPARALLTLLIAGVASLASAQANVTMPRFLEIGTAGVGGAYYPIGIAMAEILTNNLNTRATAQVTGGAVENIQLIQDDAVDIALTQSATAFKGLNGGEPFQGPNDKICGLFGSLTQGVFQIAARPGSGIQTLADLRGKRVSLGPAGGLGVELAGYVFEAAGFGISDVRATYISYEESVSAMADGNLDAVVIQTALPNPALRQLEATGKGYIMIGLPQDVIEAVVSEHPYYDTLDIPASMYRTDEDIPTLYGANMVVVDCTLSDEVVYQVTRALFENVDAIRNSHPAAKDVDPRLSARTPIPLHPGAERYFREAGFLN
jgi:TRAP transporter TAXI family solute receptor